MMNFNFNKIGAIISVFTIILLCSCSSNGMQEVENDIKSEKESQKLNNVSVSQLEEIFHEDYAVIGEEFVFDIKEKENMYFFEYINENAIYYGTADKDKNINSVRIIYHNLNHEIVSNKSEMEKIFSYILGYATSSPSQDYISAGSCFLDFGRLFFTCGDKNDDQKGADFLLDVFCSGNSFESNGWIFDSDIIDKRVILSATKV